MTLKILLINLLMAFFTFSGRAGDFLINGLEMPVPEKSIFIFKDQGGMAGIGEISKMPFHPTANAHPNFGWGKDAGWVRFSFTFPGKSDSTYLLQVNSALFDELDFYLFENQVLTAHYENLSSRTPPALRPYPHRDFVFPVKLQYGHSYTIYLRGKSFFTNVKFPLVWWKEDVFERKEKRSELFWGLVTGIFLFTFLLNVAIGLASGLRVFVFYGMYVLSLILIFLSLEGYFFEYVPYGILQNRLYDFYPYFMYSSVFWSFRFILSFARVSLNGRPILQQGLNILSVLFWLLLIPSVFNPLWKNLVSDTFIQFWGWVGRLFILVSLLWSLSAVAATVRVNQISRAYLVASLPPIMSYLVPQYFGSLIDVKVVQPYAYLAGFILEILILSAVMLLRIKKQFSRSASGIPQEQTVPSIQKTEKSGEVLSKREREILTAFANGFSYQEIAGAMFISPHTVRTHIRNIYQKLQINSKTEAVRYIIGLEKSEADQ